MIYRYLFLIFGLLSLTGCSKPKVEDVVQDGDIIFQVSESAQSKAIQLATHSKYSHCGIIFTYEKERFVFEAVQPVGSVTLKEWIDHGKGKHFVVKRLKNADDVLTPAMALRMKKTGKRFTGKDYDLYFDWSNERIYCSELVWKLYKRTLNIEVGQLQKLKDFDLTDPIVKEQLLERYGNEIPYDEKVISPGAIFESDLLETVIEE